MSNLIKDHAAIVLVEDLVAQFRAHALFNYHITSNFSSVAQITASTSSNTIIAVNQLLGNPAAQCPR